MIVDSWVFVVKEKTAYEMRISDWSSDGCSSDLAKLYVVAVQESGTAGGDGDTAPRQAVGSRDGDVQRVERELNAGKAQLRAAVDELEGSNEELKSANEEYQSVNEELQSSNEELETSKEEQPSINEELQTVNAELNGKNAALGRAISDLQKLLESTQIAQLYLTRKRIVSE